MTFAGAPTLNSVVTGNGLIQVNSTAGVNNVHTRAYLNGSFFTTLPFNAGYQNITNVPNGTYRVTLRGVASDGTESVDSAGYTVTVTGSSYVPPDTTPPSVPVISSVTNSGSSVTVSWNFNSDVAQYEVFRGGTSQGTTTNTSFTQTVSDGTYSYTVRAADAAGNWSAQSSASSVTVSTADITPPTVPVINTLSQSNGQVLLGWNSNADVQFYEVFRNGTSVQTTAAEWIVDYPSDGTYSYTVRARDSAGNWSAQSSPSSITVDTIPPAVPTISSVTSAGSSITVTWGAVATASSYEVYRNGTSQGTTSNTSFTQSGLSDGTYSYTVRAQDAAGNWSAQSTSSSITLDTVPPTVPTISSATLSGTSITVTWNSNSDVALYEVFRNGISQGTRTGTSLTQSSLADGTYSYTVRGRDTAGNWSAQSSSRSVTIDTTAPTVPVITSLTATGSTISLTWNSNSDVALWEVFRDGTSQGTTATNSFTQSGVTDGTHSYTVRARDTAGNWSAQSSSSTVTIDTTPPTIPVISSLTSTGSSVTATWNAISDAVLYEVFRDGLSQGVTTSTTLTQTGISEGSHAYTVRAKDAAGNWSTQSSPTYVTVDTIAPTIPTISTSVTGNTVQVLWNTNSDVQTYEIFRNGVSQGTSTGSSYSQTSVSDGTYTYSVRARDAAGNWSALSSGVTATVDTTPPISPIATSVASGNVVTVVWPVISDAILYEVFRNGTSQGTVTTSNFSQTVTIDGTYSYTVRAKDAAGNWSNQSVSASVTVDTIPPAIPNPSTTPPVTRVGIVNLTWSSISDATKYEVFRDGVSQGTTTQTTFTQTSVALGSYIYTVRSQDAAGNWSNKSRGVIVTVERAGLHAPPAIKTGTASDLDYSVGQRIFPNQDDIRFDRP